MKNFRSLRKLMSLQMICRSATISRELSHVESMGSQKKLLHLAQLGKRGNLNCSLLVENTKGISIKKVPLPL